MFEKLSPEEVAVVIKAKNILKAQGLSPDTDVKTICQAAGISRKTGYQWANKPMQASIPRNKRCAEQLEQLKAEHEDLKKRFDDVRFENEGRKLPGKFMKSINCWPKKKAL